MMDHRPWTMLYGMVYRPLSMVAVKAYKQKGCPQIGQPVYFIYNDLTNYPDATQHLHASHDHGHCHHWVVGSEFHERNFRLWGEVCQWEGALAGCVPSQRLADVSCGLSKTSFSNNTRMPSSMTRFVPLSNGVFAHSRVVNPYSTSSPLSYHTRSDVSFP